MPAKEAPADPVVELLNKQLDRYQAVISRLASNQVQVKTWCVTALGALAALAVNNGQRGPLVVALVMVVSFFFLDAYYLSLERHFRAESHRLVEDVIASGVFQSWPDLFRMEGPGRGQGQAWRALSACGASLAVSPFYLGLVVMLTIGFVLS